MTQPHPRSTPLPLRLGGMALGLSLAGLAGTGLPLAAATALQQTQTVTVTRLPTRPGGAGWLGVGFQQIRTPRVDELRIGAVWEGGPGAHAGLQPGDRVLQINGSPAEMELVQSLTSRLLPGDPVSLTVEREGERLEVALRADPRPPTSALVVQEVQTQLDSMRQLLTTKLIEGGRSGPPSLPALEVRQLERSDSAITIFIATQTDSGPRRSTLASATSVSGATAPLTVRTLDRRGEARADSVRVRIASEETRATVDSRRRGVARAELSPLPNPFLSGLNRVAGAALQEVNPGLGAYLGTETGLLITEVTAGTPAARSGLRPGDIVVAVDGTRVGTVEELRRLLTLPVGTHHLTLLRAGETRQVELRR